MFKKVQVTWVFTFYPNVSISNLRVHFFSINHPPLTGETWQDCVFNLHHNWSLVLSSDDFAGTRIRDFF